MIGIRGWVFFYLITNSQIFHKFTNMDCSNKVIYKDLSYKIVGILFEVYNELGYGYSEKTYEKAIAIMFDKRCIKYNRQAAHRVLFKDKEISRHYIDFIVEDKIVLEIKKGNYYSRHNIEQIKKYLASANMRLAILVHFTSKGVRIFRAFNPNYN